TLSIPRLAADLVAVLDHAAPGRVHWVGNSLGGILGLELLRGHAARFRTLATFGTAYNLDVPVWVAGAIRPAYWLLGRRLAGWLTARSTTRNAAARRLIARLIRAADPEVVGIIAQNVSRYDLIANATGVDLPILLLRCGRDLSVNRALGPTLAAIRDRPNITVVDLPEGGHCANLDATGSWRAALLEFWRMY
ncbi:MAG TPA: alpha/beta hydrolase, partial [Alphaproteobacteria bacterium]|nr:alpha/beta hydrolase [Alphaproteobacteria bacterium]